MNLEEADVPTFGHDAPAASAPASLELSQELGQGMTLGTAGGLRIVVLAEPTGAGTLTCDAVALANCRAVPCSLASRQTGVVHGNRAGTCYADVVSGLAVLCVQDGDGELRYQGRALQAMPVRPLPAEPPGARHRAGMVAMVGFLLRRAADLRS